MPRGMPKRIWGDKNPTLEERFWSRVDKTDTCWEWTGTRAEYGYGCIKIQIFMGHM